MEGAIIKIQFNQLWHYFYQKNYGFNIPEHFFNILDRAPLHVLFIDYLQACVHVLSQHSVNNLNILHNSQEGFRVPTYGQAIIATLGDTTFTHQDIHIT